MRQTPTTHLAGILHGSIHDSCTPTNREVPGLFANPYYQENYEFIQKWMAVGELLSLCRDNDLLNYMRGMTNDPYQNLGNIYPTSNDDIFASISTGLCTFLANMASFFV